MGTNLNLCKEWGAPVEVECPSCHALTYTPFEEYDVEVARQVGDNLYELPTLCMHCEHEWNFVWAPIQKDSLMMDEDTKRRAIYGLGLRAIRYYVDTGICVFCEPEGDTHEEHCNLGELVDALPSEERIWAKAEQHANERSEED